MDENAPQRFVKLPVEIEAMRWDGTEASQSVIVNWSGGKVSGWFDKDYFLKVETLHGSTRADRGDWIIRGAGGDYWPCKHVIFRQTYRPANAESLVTGEGTIVGWVETE